MWWWSWSGVAHMLAVSACILAALALTPVVLSFGLEWVNLTRQYRDVLAVIDPHGASPPALFDYGAECAVCMEAMDERPCEVSQLDCGHAFHTRCWHEAVARCGTDACPVCRRRPFRNLRGPARTYTAVAGGRYLLRLGSRRATVPVPAHHAARRALE